MEKIATNDLKKGDWVRLRCGWLAQMADNMRGNTRMAKVYGFFTEIGSVYSHDIIAKIDVDDPAAERPQRVRDTAIVVHSNAQERLRKQVESLW